MKALTSTLVLCLVLCGCATQQQKIERRKQEKYAAYSTLTPEQRAAVDKGQIGIGMPTDAVYIAWGKPDQVVANESVAGKFVDWLYFGTYLQQYTFWGGGPWYPGYCWSYIGPYMYYDYYPVNYVKGEVVFENDKVKQWRTLPRVAY